jgi:site-specific recombinase XerD
LVQRGVSLYIVSKLLGHASPKTTEIYAHLAPEKLHDVVNLLNPEEAARKLPDKGLIDGKKI